MRRKFLKEQGDEDFDVADNQDSLSSSSSSIPVKDEKPKRGMENPSQSGSKPPFQLPEHREEQLAIRQIS
jgi:hypothetical protein